VSSRRTFQASALLLGAGLWLPRLANAQALDRPGTVIALRHARAPGTGDPAGFVLGDCSTQRNLDDSGRAQARAIGRLLRAAGLDGAPVYSSRWCRCLETAELLALGPVTPLPALDSFFGARQRRQAQTEALRAFLAAEGADGPALVLVTHQVNISAVAGRGTRSGEGVVMQRLPNGGLEVVASLPPPAI
jgi:broad specificity phosphatase PhoE